LFAQHHCHDVIPRFRPSRIAGDLPFCVYDCHVGLREPNLGRRDYGLARFEDGRVNDLVTLFDLRRVPQPGAVDVHKAGIVGELLRESMHVMRVPGSHETGNHFAYMFLIRVGDSQQSRRRRDA